MKKEEKEMYGIELGHNNAHKYKEKIKKIM